jgi:hypothetical protein
MSLLRAVLTGLAGGRDGWIGRLSRPSALSSCREKPEGRRVLVAELSLAWPSACRGSRKLIYFRQETPHEECREFEVRRASLARYANVYTATRRGLVEVVASEIHKNRLDR